MNLDRQLTQLAVKAKNFILLDASFPAGHFPEFKKNCDIRYISIPGRKSGAMAMAAGIASFGKTVLVYGAGHEEIPDKTLNVKFLKESAGENSAAWEKIMDFGSGVLLVSSQNAI